MKKALQVLRAAACVVIGVGVVGVTLAVAAVVVLVSGQPRQQAPFLLDELMGPPLD